MTNHAIPIRAPAPTDPAPLYHRYPQQHRPQRAYLEIDIVRRVATWNWDAVLGGGGPPEVYHGLAIRIPCSPLLTGEQIQALSKELRPLIRRVCAGGERVWDGRNHVGHLDARATTALDEITRRLEDTEGSATVWLASDWIGESDFRWVEEHGESVAVVIQTSTITASTTDAELRVLADALQVEAAEDGVTLWNTLEALRDLRAELLPSC